VWLLLHKEVKLLFENLLFVRKHILSDKRL